MAELFWFQIEEVIDSAIDEAKEIFESESTESTDIEDIAEEETSTEEIPEEPQMTNFVFELITNANTNK